MRAASRQHVTLTAPSPSTGAPLAAMRRCSFPLKGGVGGWGEAAATNAARYYAVSTISTCAGIRLRPLPFPPRPLTPTPHNTSPPTCLRSLISQCTDADEFPPGSLFVSEPGDISGSLRMFAWEEGGAQHAEHAPEQESSSEEGALALMRPGTGAEVGGGSGLHKVPSLSRIHAH
jgi:hypothetical protein